jgi:hypothetical protein
VLSSVIECCRVLSSVVECYRVLSSVVECYRVLSSVIECCRVLSSVVECCRVLSSVVEYRTALRISDTIRNENLVSTTMVVEATNIVPYITNHRITIIGSIFKSRVLSVLV